MKIETKIKNIIKNSGPISISRYMEICLWDNENGYYTSNEILGKKGKLSKLFQNLKSIEKEKKKEKSLFFASFSSKREDTRILFFAFDDDDDGDDDEQLLLRRRSTPSNKNSEPPPPLTGTQQQ